MDCKECPIKEQLEDLREHNKSAHKEFYDKIAVLDMHSALSKKDVDSINKTLNRIEEKIDALEKEPVKKYNLIVSSIITNVIGIAIGFIIAQMR